MRYKAENRKTFLYAENYTAGAANTTPNSVSTPASSNELNNSAGKKNAKKKNVPIASASTSSTTPTTASAAVSPSKIETIDGVFPKIEVNLASYL
jgi:predicted flap endonuclease-1-like 5' DNA nuclease